METICQLLLPTFDFILTGDENGCLNKYAHFDDHICILSDGRIIKWQYEFCSDCKECDPSESQCFVSQQILVDEVKQVLIKNYDGILPTEVHDILSKFK